MTSQKHKRNAFSAGHFLSNQKFMKFLAIMEPKRSSPPFLAPAKTNIILLKSL